MALDACDGSGGRRKASVVRALQLAVLSLHSKDGARYRCASPRATPYGGRSACPSQQTCVHEGRRSEVYCTVRCDARMAPSRQTHPGTARAPRRQEMADRVGANWRRKDLDENTTMVVSRQACFALRRPRSRCKVQSIRARSSLVQRPDAYGQVASQPASQPPSFPLSHSSPLPVGPPFPVHPKLAVEWTCRCSQSTQTAGPREALRARA